MYIRNYLLIVLITSCYLVTSCSFVNNTSSNNFIVMEYKDFGPQDIAEKLIGPNYWQWDSDHYIRPQKFDIKVVIYRKMKLEKIKEMFPVDKKNKKDFRYVQYRAAMDWYDKQINNFNEDLANNSGDINITFYFLKNLYANSLKIERALRK